MSTPTFSPAFLKSMSLKAGPLIVLVRIIAIGALWPVALLGRLLCALGNLGQSLVDWQDDWLHEVSAFTAPPVWTEIITLKNRCERAEERLRLLGAVVN